jgi:rhamnosyltransferase
LNKVSVVIRNRNEAFYLKKSLEILNTVYKKDILEIIVIDNESNDNSLKVAEDHGCRIVKITDFTYGKAINMGISEAKSNIVLLLSAHAVPVGNSFFKNSLEQIKLNPKVAGIRFINSISNYERAIKNEFKVKDPLRFGLMAGCCLINKKIWEIIKFDECLSFSEDKEWSLNAINAGYDILDFNEGFFYFINRDHNSLVSRFRNETLAEYQLHNKKFPSRFRIFLSFLYSALMKNTVTFFKKMSYDYRIMKAKFYISHKLRNK